MTHQEVIRSLDLLALSLRGLQALAESSSVVPNRIDPLLLLFRSDSRRRGGDGHGCHSSQHRDRQARDARRDAAMTTLGAALLFALALIGCSTVPVRLQHPGTGQVVECGPYFQPTPFFPTVSGVYDRERDCIKDYQRQGYERVP